MVKSVFYKIADWRPLILLKLNSTTDSSSKVLQFPQQQFLRTSLQKVASDLEITKTISRVPFKEAFRAFSILKLFQKSQSCYSHIHPDIKVVTQRSFVKNFIKRRNLPDG